MKNPLGPFAMIGLLGIILAISLSGVGLYFAGQDHEEVPGEDLTDPEEIYASNSCIACHGANLEGVSGPNISQVGASKSKEEILSIIQNGGNGMPGNIITGAQADIVAEWLANKK
jgi:mono/diheme cytochrome c family protein